VKQAGHAIAAARCLRRRNAEEPVCDRVCSMSGLKSLPDYSSASTPRSIARKAGGREEALAYSRDTPMPSKKSNEFAI